MRRVSQMAITLRFLALILVYPLLCPLLADAGPTLGVTPKWESTIDGASFLSSCKGSIWVYSSTQKKIYQLNPSTGAILSQAPFQQQSTDSPVQAITCFQDSLILASSSYIFRFNDATRLNAPTPEVHGLTCDKKTCWALGEQVYRSEDLNHWTLVRVPESKDVSDPSSNVELNPFCNWQDQFQLCRTRYTKLRVDSTGAMYFLDALKSSVVIANANLSGARKWGISGHFEGELMFPRGLGVLSNGDVVIADTGLKLVFIFSSSGIYKGFVGADAKLKRFEYPLDVIVQDKVIYVSDFGAGRLHSFDLSNAHWPPEPEKKTVDQLLVSDLMQNQSIYSDLERTRCLSCHDGTEKNNLHSFGKMGAHHPVGKALTDDMLTRGKTNAGDPQGKFPLPLGPGNTVSCNSCHDGHHESHPGESVGRHGERKKVAALPFKLRTSEQQLCSTCHSEKSDISRNHIGLAKEKLKVSSCEQCHDPHASFPHMLVDGVPELCVNCHRNQQDQIHKGLSDHKIFHDQKSNCLECHNPHQSESGAKAAHFLKDRGANGVMTCVRCHKEMKDGINQNPHLNEHEKGGGQCIQCHSPHRLHADLGPKASAPLCIKCHTGRGQQHKALIATADTERGKGIHLSNERVACITCHEPHGLSHKKKYLRDENELVPFCASCHAEKATGLFEHYHQRTKR